MAGPRASVSLEYTSGYVTNASDVIDTVTRKGKQGGLANRPHAELRREWEP
jgi:hypothetical protein